MPELRESLAELVRLMVDYPDEVEVDQFMDGDETVFELFVAQDDLGKVIGRKGRTARALRTLLDARGALEDRLYDLEIVDDD
ncbi:MAG: KH domain-containing protein [Acidobacteriota bacterium]